MLSVDDTWNYLMLPGFLPAEGVLDAFGVVPIALGGGGLGDCVVVRRL